MSLVEAAHARHKAFHRLIAIKAMQSAPRPVNPVARPIDLEYEIAWRREILGEEYTLPARARPDPRYGRIGQIQNVVCLHYGVAIDDMLANNRGSPIVTRARHVAAFICRNLTTASYPTLGKVFGGRDHSTMVVAIKRMRISLQSDVQLQASMAMLTDLLERPFA